MFTNEIRLIQKYSLESLKSALMEVRNGTSTILGASKIYGVPPYRTESMVVFLMMPEK